MRKYILPLIVIICLIFGLNALAISWDISTAIYENKSFNHVTQEGDAYGFTFSPNGDKLYLAGNQYNAIFQYALSIPWDISTVVYADKSMDVSGQDTIPVDLDFSPDGSNMYIVGYGSGTVYWYILETAWDVSTATYTDYIDLSALTPYNINLSSDGSIMYVMGDTTVYQHNLEMPWDISTAVYADKCKDMSSQDANIYGITFNPDGNLVFMVGDVHDMIYQYELAIPWDIPTAVYTEKFKDVSDQGVELTDVAFTFNGDKMYVMEWESKTIFQYLMPVGWDHKWNTREIAKWNTKEIIKWNGLE